MTVFFSIICLLVVAQLVYPFVTVLLAQCVGRNTVQVPDVGEQAREHDFACIITAYRNAAIAGPLVASLLRQTHSKSMIYLVADECDAFDLGISDERLCVLVPPQPLRLKAKSIDYALAHFRREPDFVVIFDADNLAHPQFLAETNRFAKAGFHCIQGQRTAKNLDTTYAALDSMGEHYKNYLEREVPFRLGGSAVISGSGMATETGLYRTYLQSPDIEQGKYLGKKMLQEDKILQNFLLRRGERIAYARQAIVYDEKVETGEAVTTQRGRWLFSYFQNLPNALGILRRGLLGLNINQIYFGFVTLVLPMFIQLGLAFALFLVAFFAFPGWAWALFGSMALFVLTIFGVLWLDRAPAEVWRAVWQAPRFVWRQLAGLRNMRDPNKNFQHTEHRKMISIDEVERRKSDS